MAYLFNAINSVVEIFLDDGTGTIEGNAIMTLRFRRATGISGEVQGENIPHAGSPTYEIALGTSGYSLILQRLAEDSDTDMRLSNALYVIRVTARSDKYESWVRYTLQRCRRLVWDMDHGEQGAVNARASFAFEDYTVEDL